MENKKVSAGQLCADIKLDKKSIVINNVEVSVKPFLTSDECIDFISNVSIYILERYVDWKCAVYIDRILRLFTIFYYTNIDTTEMLHSQNDESLDIKLAYETPLFAMLTGTKENPQYFHGTAYTDAPINIEQYTSMIDAINESVKKWNTFSAVLRQKEEIHEEA